MIPSDLSVRFLHGGFIVYLLPITKWMPAKRTRHTTLGDRLVGVARNKGGASILA